MINKKISKDVRSKIIILSEEENNKKSITIFYSGRVEGIFIGVTSTLIILGIIIMIYKLFFGGICG